MIKQSDLALAAWKATERTLDAVVTINKSDYKTTDIASISYDAGGYTGDTFGIGSNYENSVTIKFSHLIEGLKPGMTVLPKIGVKTSSGYEYSSLGLFIVSDDIQMDRNNDETTIKAYDQMCLLEGTYNSKLTYPAKMTRVIAEIANLAGVALNTIDIGHLTTQGDLPGAITGQTYRNAIGMIAQFYAGFATFDRDGKLTIRTIAEPDYMLDPSQYEQGGLTKNEAPYKIGGIQCEVTTATKDSTGQSTETTSTLQVGSTSGSQVKLTNNLMTMDRLTSIWQQLQSLTFYPFSLNWFGNPAIEAGDWLTLQDTKGNKFNVPNNGYTMTFDGSLSAVSKADQTSTSSSSYAWRGELSQYVADLGGRQGASGNYIYGTDTTEPPYGAKLNDIWYKQNGNKIELWTYERQTDGTGKWVLTVSDATGEEVKTKVEQAQKDATTSIEHANDAVTKANDAVTRAGFATDTASQAQQDAQTAGNNALAALTNAKNAVNTASGASTDASSALANANSALGTANTALTNANSAGTDATNALSNAKTALGTSNTALVTANTASDAANVVSETVTKLKGGSTLSIAELENGLQSKVSQTDFDGLTTGAPNLILNSGKFSNEDNWSHSGSLTIVKHEFWKNNTENIFQLRTDGTAEVTASSNYFVVSPGGTYTVQIEAFRNVNMIGMDIWFLGRKFGSAKGFDVAQKLITSDLLSTAGVIYREITFKVSSDVDEGYLRIDNNGSNIAGTNADLYFTDIKLAKETKASPWAPAPDDFATNVNLAQVEQTVTTHSTQIQQDQNAITTKVDKSVVDNLNQKVTVQGTSIQANANNIALKANQSVVDKLNQTVATQGLAITAANDGLKLKADSSSVNTLNQTVAKQGLDIIANANGIKSKASQSDFDELEIGGTNLVPGTSKELQTKHDLTGWGNVGVVWPPRANLVGKYYARAWVQDATYDTTIYVTVSDAQGVRIGGNWVGSTLPAGKSGYVGVLVTVPNGGHIASVSVGFTVSQTVAGSISWKEVKLEHGTKPTSWSPAPEDVASSKELSDLNKTVTTQSTMLQQTQSSLVAKADKSIVDTLGQKVTTQGTSIQANANDIAMKASQSQVDKLNQTVTSQGVAITAANDGLKLKADNSRVDTINQTVASQGLAISANANNFNVELNKTNSALTGLAKSRDNLILKSWFDDKSIGTWQSGTSYFEAAAAKTITGHIGLLKFTLRDTGEAGNDFEVSPGETYYFEAWLSALHANYDAGLGIRIMKSDGTMTWQKAINATKGTGITKYTGSVVIPADSVTAAPWLQISGPAGNDLGYACGNGFRISRNSSAAVATAVATNTVAIKANEDGLSLKANQANVDTLAGRVTTAEGSLNVMNNKIAQTVSKSELTTTLGGYATQSWTQGQISTTANSITSTVSAVQAQVDTSAVGTNLLRNANDFDSKYWTDSVGDFSHV
ncbi:hypothetical protein [Lactiplantibacillus pentosus]|uniref:hypothetical protein n=1 Tax=Lactiplantibacillus pentosus TaxID=1589 RepID=UPI003D2EB34C